MSQHTVHGVVFLDAPTGQYVAMCLEYGVVTQGDSEEHAFEMLREAVELHLEDTPKRELELTYQPVDSEPVIRTITVRAEAPLTVHGLVFLDRATGQYVAKCLENDVTTQGDNEGHAFDMLREAVELELEDAPAPEDDWEFQTVDSEPIVRTLRLDAAPVLNS